MNEIIKDMSRQRKSELLAKVVGIKREDATIVLLDDGIPDLYDLANMALAWRVHRWMLRSGKKGDLAKATTKYRLYWYEAKPYLFESAQRLWLDEILSLLIEASSVELEEWRRWILIT